MIQQGGYALGCAGGVFSQPALIRRDLPIGYRRVVLRRAGARDLVSGRVVPLPHRDELVLGPQFFFLHVVQRRVVQWQHA